MSKSVLGAFLIAVCAIPASADGISPSRLSSDAARVSVSVPVITAVTLARATAEGTEISIFQTGETLIILRVPDQKSDFVPVSLPRAGDSQRSVTHRGAWSVLRDTSHPRRVTYEIWQF